MIKSAPAISVVLPVYNGEKYLHEAIDSILNQSFIDFECLIINDGSTDQTEKIILEYASKDRRIKYHDNGQNLGLVKTLNRGLELARGTYIARMDADDICHKERFEKQVSFLDKNPDVSICGTFYQTFGNGNSTIKLPVINDEIKTGLLISPQICHPSVMYRKSFIEQSGIKYLPETFPAEDYRMWVDCIKITKLHNIPEVLLYYREHDKQITKEKHKWQLEQVNKVRLEILDYLYPDFTEAQKRFHIETFLSYSGINLDEFRDHKNWGKVLLLKNKELGQFDDLALRNEIRHYLNKRIYRFFLKKIQNNKNNRIKKLKVLYLYTYLFFHLNVKQKLKLFSKIIH